MRIELILLGCCLVACTALAREVSSTISQVTVYNSMALLQREVKLQLNAGENRIEIGHLPTALMDESVHIRLGDEGQVQISDVKVERWFLEKAEELQVKDRRTDRRPGSAGSAGGQRDQGAEESGKISYLHPGGRGRQGVAGTAAG